MSTDLEIIGTRLNVTIRDGVDTGVIEFAVTNDDGEPYDISAWTWAGGVYDISNREKLADWVFDDTLAADGVLKFSIAKEVISDLTSVSISDDPLYSHWINALADGNTLPVLYGDFRKIWGTGE